MARTHAFFDAKGPIAFAHRGGDERFPENTMAAFQDAYKLGYRYFETDVHFTAGGELVAFHDDDLERTLGLKGVIASMTKNDRATKLLGGKHQVPLLSELLEAFPDTYFNIDAKSAAAVEPLLEAIQKHQAADRVCLASFGARNIRRMRRLFPDTPTIATRYEIAGLRAGSITARLLKADARYLEVPVYAFYEQGRGRLVTSKFIQELHASGHKIFVWTVNEMPEMEELLDMGVDGLFTDKIRLLKQVLQARGQWPAPASVTAKLPS
jgi:glycerophosphoryl diester phosphodiesterase